MCPMIMTAVSVVTGLAGAAVQAAGIQQQAEGAARQAEHEAMMETRRAEMAERQEVINQTQASYERRRTVQRWQRVLGNNRAAGAARGLSETGSLVDVQDENAMEVAHDIEAIRYRAEGERGNLDYEAASARLRSDNQTQLASDHRKAGSIGAAGAFLGGVTGAFTTLGNAFARRPLTT